MGSQKNKMAVFYSFGFPFNYLALGPKARKDHASLLYLCIPLPGGGRGLLFVVSGHSFSAPWAGVLF